MSVAIWIIYEVYKNLYFQNSWSN